MSDAKNDREKRRMDELDDFWNVDSLLPKKRYAPPPSRDTSAVDVFSEPKETTATEPKRHVIPPHSEEREAARRREQLALLESEYTPDNPLIERVQIFRTRRAHPYYEQFATDARKIFPIHGKESAHVPFFSYAPQYSQMNRDQFEWYLWWRENLRRGVLLPTDYSYLLLYLYEQINLPERIHPEVGRDEMVVLWSGYRKIFRQLDESLPRWIGEYCLIHRLPLPESREFREYYLSKHSSCLPKEACFPTSGGDVLPRAMLTFCSNYDYAKSKFCTDETLPLFDRVITGALREVLSRTDGEGKPFLSVVTEKMAYNGRSYAGAICASSAERQIKVIYRSVVGSHELRLLITDIIRYTENRIRATLGTKSRLGVYALPTSIRQILDRYLDETLPAPRATKTDGEIPDYERRYDLPQTPISFENAKRIESESWETTERLVEAFDETETEEIQKPAPFDPSAVVEAAPIPEEGTTDTPFAPYLPFLRAVLDRDPAAERAAAERLSSMVDAVADRVNELAADETGDILIEACGDGYTVIEDYRSFVEELLQ